MKYATIIMWVIAAVLFAILYKQGKDVSMKGIAAGWQMFYTVIPLLMASFLIAGIVQVLIPKEFIANWLSDESGMRGIFLGCFAGAITPGGPFVSFPIVASLYKSGAGIGTVVGFVTAWSLWAVARLPLEISLIGTKVTLIRIASTLVFPPLAGIIARLVFK
ncbi:permease [candidate division KSB1 bacterium]